MHFTVRCKFYVTACEVRKHANLSEDHPDNVPYATVHFNAVKSNQVGSENHAYWTASPNGTMKLTGKLEDLERFIPGTYWYIDFVRIDWDLMGCDVMLAKDEVKTKYREKLLEPNVWQLGSMETSRELSILNVKLGMSRGWTEVSGEFAVAIQNSKVWSQYQRLGDLYEMSISPAEKEG